MRVTLVYELPYELEAYKQALMIKNSLSNSDAPLEEFKGIKELHTAIMKYMLQPKHDNLMHLNRMLDKYG